MLLRSSWFATALSAWVALGVFAHAHASALTQDPIIPDPVVTDPPSEKSEDDPFRNLGRPIAERGKLGPDLVIPRPGRGMSSDKARRRLPDLPQQVRPSKPAVEAQTEVATDQSAKIALPKRSSISEASSARLVESLMTRPRVNDEEGREIFAELSVRGSEARLSLRRGLSSKRIEVVENVAELLFEIADAEDLVALKNRALAGLTASVTRRFAEHFLRLQPADHSWIDAWFESSNPNLRAEAEARAIALQLPSEAFRARLHHAHPDVRRRALRVLEQANDPEMETFALQLLDDDHSPTAQTCVALLLKHGDERTFAALLQRVRTFSYDRSWGRAITVVLERESAHADALLELSDMAGCAAAFSHPDPFVATSGAAAVGAIAMRRDDAEASLWLRERVPHLLIRALSGEVAHADMPLLRPSILALLKRMSGMDFGSDGNAWKMWWGRVGGSFTPRRAFFVLDPTALMELEIIYTVATEEEVRELRFRQTTPEILDAAGCPLEQRWLEAADMRGLYEALVKSRLATAEWPAGRMGEVGFPMRRLEVRSGERTKSVEGGPAVVNERWDELCQVLDDLATKTSWQPYVDVDLHPRWGQLREQELAWWQEAHSEAERRARLRGLILHALDDQDPALAAEAYWELEKSIHPGDQLDLDTRQAMMDLLRDVDQFEPLHRALIDLLAKHSDASVLDDLKTFFALRPVRYAERLILADLLVAAGPQAVRTALDDSRSPVLAGAAEAAYVLSVDPPLIRLVGLMRHESLQVRLGAVRSLGRLGAEGAATPLLALCENGELEERLEAAEALARMCAPAALPVLTRILTGTDPLMRRAIFTGFAASDSLSASLALASYAIGPASSSLDGIRARVAFLAKPVDQIRLVCRSLCEEVTTRRSAALLWAEAFDREALPELIALLEETPDDAGVMQGMEWLCCRTLEIETALATMRSFLAAHEEETPQHWFLRACEEQGLPVPGAPDALRMHPSSDTLFALCRVLELGTPQMRMHAARYLRAGTREELGYVTLTTKPEECAEIAQGYRELLIP